MLLTSPSNQCSKEDTLGKHWFISTKTEWLHRGLTVLQNCSTCEQPRGSRHGFHSSWKSQNQTFRLLVQRSFYNVYVCVCVCVTCSVMSDSLRPHGLPPSWLLCPQNSPGKNTGVGCHVLLQGIFHMAGRLFTVWIAREDLFTMLHVKTWSSEQWQQTPRATEKWGLAQETKKQTDWRNQRAHPLRVQNHKEKRKSSMQYYEKTQNFKEELWTGVAKVGNCCCQVSSVVSDSVRRQSRQPSRLPRPWDSPGKNTGVGCHLLLQCMKVKSESEVVQLCPTLHDPMDCSPPASSVHRIFQARVLEWGATAFSKVGNTIS